MRILVTGSSGLVGSEIFSQSTVHEFIPLRSKDVDLRDYTQTCKYIEKILPIDGIINLAANVGGLFKNLKYPVEMLQDNLLININVLRVAHKYNINRVLCCLSTCIFPYNPPSFPMTHEMIHLGPPHYSNQGYAYAKRMTDMLCKAYRDKYKRDYFCVIPPNVYGRFDHFDDVENSHVIPALITKIYNSLDEKILIKGDGTPKRQFIYSEDLAKLIIWAFETYKDFEVPLIICPPNSEISIKEVVEIISKECNFKGKIEFENTDCYSNGQIIKTVDTPEIIKFFKFTSFEEGIRKIIEWVRQNQPSP
jgi:GDP-L-fucose synthase